MWGRQCCLPSAVFDRFFHTFSPFGPTGPTRGFNINRGDFWGWGQFAPTQGRVIKNRRSSS